MVLYYGSCLIETHPGGQQVTIYFVSYLPFWDELEKFILNEVFAQNPENFGCTDDTQRIQ